MSTPLAPEKPSLGTFGGPYKDADGVVDPETEVSSAALNRLLAQVAMLSMTAPKAIARILVIGGVVQLAYHSAVWGDTDAVKPGFSRDGTGQYSLTWASSYADLQAVPEMHSVSFKGAIVMPEVNTTARRIPSYTLADAQIGITFSNDTGALADPDGFTVVLF